MKYWVQFLRRSATNPAELIDAIGDRSVFFLDGRNSQETMIQDALKQAQRMEHWQKYEGFQLVMGRGFTHETRRGPVQLLRYPVKV